jgi:hypothetical protein
VLGRLNSCSISNLDDRPSTWCVGHVLGEKLDHGDVASEDEADNGVYDGKSFVADLLVDAYEASRSI